MENREHRIVLVSLLLAAFLPTTMEGYYIREREKRERKTDIYSAVF